MRQPHTESLSYPLCRKTQFTKHLEYCSSANCKHSLNSNHSNKTTCRTIKYHHKVFNFILYTVDRLGLSQKRNFVEWLSQEDTIGYFFKHPTVQTLVASSIVF